MFTFMCFFFVFWALVEIHFMSVVWTHYKNWKDDNEAKERHVLQDENQTA